MTTRKAVLLVEVFVLLSLSCGCRTAAAPIPAPSQTQAPKVAPEPRAENVSGDVHQPTITEMEESARESGVETGGGSVGGGVSTVRYGLDDGTRVLLERYAGTLERAVGALPGLLVRVLAAVGAGVVGLLVLAWYSNAPANGRMQFIGQIVGLAALVGGPILVWTVL